MFRYVVVHCYWFPCCFSLFPFITFFDWSQFWIRHQDRCASRCNFCSDKSLWMTFHARYDELHAFICPRHSSLGLDPVIEMWTTDSNSLECIRSLGVYNFHCASTMKSRPLPCILFHRYRNASSRLPLSRLENSLLCKMELSVPLSIPLMTRPPLCYCLARLCLLFADVLSDCCVWLLRLQQSVG